MTNPDAESADVLVVGAGIVGLACAYEAAERGLSVVVVERDARATGASVRNFGHACATAQSGKALGYGRVAREVWLRLADAAGFWAERTGTLMVARSSEELAVLEEFSDLRGEEAQMVTAAEVAEHAGFGAGVVGGAWLPQDLRVDPREAVAKIAAYLQARGVRFHWNTTAHGIEPGEVTTSRETLHADQIVVATGHDVDRHFPQLAAAHGVQRCALRMLRVENPGGGAIEPAVQTGFSMLRYGGFAECPSLPTLRDRLTRETPDLVAIGLNLMFTQRPDGTLTIGDTHSYATTPAPFEDEELDAAVLRETAKLLGAERLTVRERWRGIYASAPEPFLDATPVKGVRVAAVTAGVGMTTGFGFAREVMTDVLA
ncbi:FAD dependent oxidoreductase TIGR03364 [Catenulispora acidiphila DSM 44928]|uniref:FAD dependent oxidoreductase TIGR03364 n=1 Tax=Catenulispora acidiphila (strain DSM 44928 / JCM 14897 / NBRC 102108 / NRRL B-24433 / ID139908) TaxID=479433 RepID=C7QIJ6_CATAD|nr:TIGR03364 family FAD-dependent oxidoreductase [Catenulispora acidiphila]ACU75073.1 FAD dependent oxidoreductase TIGR03364 [Catenulispora acidiphila DSM 44928]